jgi:hypothetical protein
MGMIIVTVFVVSGINAADDPQRESFPRERRDKRDDELNRSTQLGYQKQASEEMSRQYHQQRGNGLLETGAGILTFVGVYFATTRFWSWLSGKKTEAETQSSSDKQPESVTPSDTAASAGSESQSSASSSDSSPQN